MGDINFNITKNVDLNKTVNLDIDKDVNVNVNNPDILATAEADAEAFGPNALAEVDAYTYVNREEGNDGVIELFPAEVNANGNSTNFLVEGEFDTGIPNPNDPGNYLVANSLTVNFTMPTELPNGDIVPDVDDVNGSGKFVNLFPPPVPGDNTLPVNDNTQPAPGSLSFDINPDISLINPRNFALDDPDGNGVGEIEATYDLEDDIVINFGERTLDIQPGNEGDPCDNCGDELTGILTLTVPEGTDFRVIYTGPTEPVGINPPDGPIEINFLEFDQGGAFFTFAGATYDVTELTMVLGSTQGPANESSWSFQAETQLPMCVDCDGDGEAFAYAESTAALDLV